MAKIVGKGYGLSFGDASTDRVILYVVLGIVAYGVYSAKDAAGNILNGGKSMWDSLFGSRPTDPQYSIPSGSSAQPGTTPDPAFTGPQQQLEVFPNAYGGTQT